jgi:hypothetical protein
MATKEISELAPASVLVGDELLPIAQAGLTRQISITQLGAVAPAGPKGDQGDTGPQGPPGASSQLFPYSYNAKATAPPLAGQLRSDGDNFIDSTVLWAHRTTPTATASTH